MEIEMISRENIKPSSPTPCHLRNYKLSLLDQHVPPTYATALLVYAQNSTDRHPTSGRTLQLLKASLPQTLTYFYPFSGRFKDRLTIDCNDEGVYFAEARVKTHMTEGFYKRPNFTLLQRFLPRASRWHEIDSDSHVCMLQVNLFDCGGIVIAILASHMVADGIAIGNFIKGWFAIASGHEAEAPSPSYISSSLFPQNNSVPAEARNSLVKKGKSVTSRFTFDAKSLSALKIKATNPCDGYIPTRVESVTALLWKSFVATRASLSGTRRPCFVTHTVDIRRRASPPFPESYMGNWTWVVVASCCKDEYCAETELYQLVGEIKRAMKKVDAQFVEQLQGDSGVLKFEEACREMSQEIEAEEAGGDWLSFSSWLNRGTYTVDFGWGKPELVTTVGFSSESMYVNRVILMDTKEGDGMEALVDLSEQDMAIFERDRELLSFAS